MSRYSRESVGWQLWLLIVAGVIVLVAGLFALSAWIFRLLWNWLSPDVFNGPTITFWQAVGIVLILSFVGKASTAGRGRG